MTKKLYIDVLEIKKAAKTLRAINHILRQQMIALLYEKEKMTVTEIYKAFRLEQSVASQHLGILRNEGLVIVKRSGKERYYSVVNSRLSEINSYAKALSINQK